MAKLRFTILGCGSSGGVPRLGGLWGACDPTDPKNRRTRCSMLVERFDGDDVTRVLIDTSPDMRQQLLNANVGALDGVVFTHQHADHTHGIDDLRMIVINMRQRLSVWANEATKSDLMSRFSYAFVQPVGSSYPPILEMNDIEGPVVINGAGGDIKLSPFEVVHGNINALGFRIADLAYLPDVSDIPPPAWDHLNDLKCWVLDCLRYTPHPSHTHLEQSLKWIERAAPKQAVLTNLHIDLDHKTLTGETNENIAAAFDGMTIEFEV
ncbi:beta-lactamase-like protein [Rhodobacterales bacterium HTCC2150]|nr:beta-lactamase-like protein [Rhodobacterales bacterium HTCC2150] [Rhodobacteraceae bacterium HTCC2150]